LDVVPFIVARKLPSQMQRQNRRFKPGQHPLGSFLILLTFIKTSKAELIWRRTCEARRQAETATSQYSNGIHNPSRRHIRHLEGQLRQSPLRFVVDHNGTIVLANYLPDASRRAAYDVSPKELELGEGLYDFLDRIEALRSEIYAFSQGVRDGTVALEDWDTESVEAFIDSLQADELEELRAHLLAWVSEEVSLEERDDGDIVQPVDGQHWAYRIFAEETDAELLDAVKIVVVDGEASGSTYFAAELGSGVEDANRTAAHFGLPIIFAASR